VTLSGFAGGKYLSLPAEFGYCRYAVPECCGLKDGITPMDTGVLWKLRKLRNPLGLIKIDIPFNSC